MERLDELVAKAQAALDAVLAGVADAAQEAAAELAEKIDALSTKVDEIQAAWANRPVVTPVEDA